MLRFVLNGRVADALRDPTGGTAAAVETLWRRPGPVRHSAVRPSAVRASAAWAEVPRKLFVKA